MLALTLAGIVLLVAGVSAGRGALDGYIEGFFDIFIVSFIGLLVGGLAGGATLVGVTGVANLAFDHHDHYQGVDLVAIRDGSTLTGAFVWGSGNIGPDGKYSFYYQVGDAKVLTSVESSGIKLYEDSDHAYAVYYTGCTLSPDWVAPCFYEGNPWKEIHVPPGTVKVQTSLGLNP